MYTLCTNSTDNQIIFVPGMLYMEANNFPQFRLNYIFSYTSIF